MDSAGAAIKIGAYLTFQIRQWGGGHVTLRCGLRSTPDQPAALPYLEVEDDGTGPDALQRPRVLERFYGVPDSAGEGSGLGWAWAWLCSMKLPASVAPFCRCLMA